MGVKSLSHALSKFPAVLFDTNSVIYYLDDVSPYNTILEEILGLVEVGQIKAYLSVITTAEILVKPLQKEDKSLASNYLRFFNFFPNLTVVDTTREIAIQAAIVKASTGMKLPDAIIIATAAVMRCPVLGNDKEWQKKQLPTPYIYLQEYM